MQGSKEDLSHCKSLSKIMASEIHIKDLNNFGNSKDLNSFVKDRHYNFKKFVRDLTRFNNLFSINNKENCNKVDRR